MVFVGPLWFEGGSARNLRQDPQKNRYIYERDSAAAMPRPH